MERQTQSINTTRLDRAEHNGYNITFNIVINLNALESISVMGYKDGNYAFKVNKN